MGNNARKKQQEEYWIRQFIKKAGNGLENTEIVQSETPDFILRDNFKTISVEVTSLINSEIRKKESLEEKIVRLAKDKFWEKYSEPLYILVSFTEEPIACKDKEIEQYSHELFILVEQLYAKWLSRNISFAPFYDEDFDEGYIARIDISKDGDFNHWQPFGAFAVGDIAGKTVLDSIKGKELILEKYRARFQENWLLMVANLGNESSTHGFNCVRRTSLQTRFDHVYIYQYMDNEIITLK